MRQQSRVELCELRLQYLGQERRSDLDPDRAPPLAHPAIRLDPITAHQGDEEPPRPRIRQGELVFDQRLRSLKLAEPRLDSFQRGASRFLLPLASRPREERLDLA